MALDSPREHIIVHISLRWVIARSGSGCEAKPKQTRRFLALLGTGSAISRRDCHACVLERLTASICFIKTSTSACRHAPFPAFSGTRNNSFLGFWMETIS
jgi:hypothetical protein